MRKRGDKKTGISIPIVALIVTAILAVSVAAWFAARAVIRSGQLYVDTRGPVQPEGAGIEQALEQAARETGLSIIWIEELKGTPSPDIVISWERDTGFTLAFDPFGWLVDTELLTANRLPVPDTWIALERRAPELVTRGIVPMLIPARDDRTLAAFLAVLYEAETGRSGLESMENWLPRTAAALSEGALSPEDPWNRVFERIRRWTSMGLIPRNWIDWDKESVTVALGSGKVASVASWYSDSAAFRAAARTVMQFSRFPDETGRTNYSLVTGAATVRATGAKGNLAGTARFMDALRSNDALPALLEADGSLTPTGRTAPRPLRDIRTRLNLSAAVLPLPPDLSGTAWERFIEAARMVLER